MPSNPFSRFTSSSSASDTASINTTTSTSSSTKLLQKNDAISTYSTISSASSSVPETKKQTKETPLSPGEKQKIKQKDRVSMQVLAMHAALSLVSGANQGIGYEIAKQLSQIPGYHTILGSREVSKGNAAASQIQQVGGSVEALQLDVTDRSSISAARDYIASKYNRLDVLVNNAAVLLDFHVSPSYSLGQAMQDTFATNTAGAADLTETLVPLLNCSSLPRLVFVSSSAGSLHAFANFTPSYTATKYFAPAYACSKAALNMLMLHYNVKYASQGWKVNACCPGFRKTGFCDYDDKAGPVDQGAGLPSSWQLWAKTARLARLSTSKDRLLGEG